MRGPFNQREPFERLDALEEKLFVEKMVREEIKLVGPPVADMERMPGAAGKIKAVKEFPAAQGAQRGFGGSGDRLAAPFRGFVMIHGGAFSLEESGQRPEFKAVTSWEGTPNMSAQKVADFRERRRSVRSTRVISDSGNVSRNHARASLSPYSNTRKIV
jgi:hypothetical protein